MINISVKDAIKILIEIRKSREEKEDSWLFQIYKKTIEPQLEKKHVDVEKMINDLLTENFKIKELKNETG
jgi:hypothetical protein